MRYIKWVMTEHSMLIAQSDTFQSLPYTKYRIPRMIFHLLGSACVQFIIHNVYCILTK